MMTFKDFVEGCQKLLESRPELAGYKLFTLSMKKEIGLNLYFMILPLDFSKVKTLKQNMPMNRMTLLISPMRCVSTRRTYASIKYHS